MELNYCCNKSLLHQHVKIQCYGKRVSNVDKVSRYSYTIVGTVIQCLIQNHETTDVNIYVYVKHESQLSRLSSGWDRVDHL